MFSGLTALLIATGGAIIAILAAYMKGELNGARKERAKQLEGKVEAAEDRLEMHREATRAEREAAALSDEAAREEAMRWTKR